MADELNTMLAACGVNRSQLRAVADTDALGHGVVRLEGIAAGWLQCEELLLMAREVARHESA